MSADNKIFNVNFFENEKRVAVNWQHKRNNPDNLSESQEVISVFSITQQEEIWFGLKVIHATTPGAINELLGKLEHYQHTHEEISEEKKALLQYAITVVRELSSRTIGFRT